MKTISKNAGYDFLDEINIPNPVCFQYWPGLPEICVTPSPEDSKRIKKAGEADVSVREYVDFGCKVAKLIELLQGQSILVTTWNNDHNSLGSYKWENVLSRKAWKKLGLQQKTFISKRPILADVGEFEILFSVLFREMHRATVGGDFIFYIAPLGYIAHMCHHRDFHFSCVRKNFKAPLINACRKLGLSYFTSMWY